MLGEYSLMFTSFWFEKIPRLTISSFSLNYRELLFNYNKKKEYGYLDKCKQISIQSTQKKNIAIMYLASDS